jgi:hypothetical protein
MKKIVTVVLDFATFRISMILEPMLDELEYRLAKRAQRKSAT